MLGLLNDVLWMCGRIGWTRFITLQYPTYLHLTYEFLSSLILNTERGDRYLSFRLLNNEYTLTMIQLNSIFGFTLNGNHGIASDFHSQFFWAQISGQPNYDASRAKASLVHNPCFRYLQRFMAHTIFGRGDSDGVVRQTELYFMWGMIKEYPIDSGFFLVKQFIKVALAQRGDIVLGGLITPIARYFRLDLTAMEIAEGSTRIDLESLMAMKMLRKEGDRYHLIFRDSDFRIMLPQPLHTSVQQENNWLYEVETDRLVDDALEPIVGVEFEAYEEEFVPGAGEAAHVAPEGHDDQPQPPPRPTLASLYSSVQAIRADQQVIRDEQHRQGEEQRRQAKLIDAIYNWHISQGHFGPPSP